MKTDLIEIFQTIRAELQPYAALSFNNRINSEEAYDLWSEKNIKDEGITERFFAEVKIESDHVVFRYSSLTGDGEQQDEIRQLDDVTMKKLDDELSATYKVFKEQEWV
ncbi:MAG: hypothetical protein JWQ28_2503 [Pedobacter sp.]|jgi:hypothetical protein|nr:hypothetical protein [Pedobacter sp.]